jgi:hypothetical protein
MDSIMHTFALQGNKADAAFRRWWAWQSPVGNGSTIEPDRLVRHAVAGSANAGDETRSVSSVGDVFRQARSQRQFLVLHPPQLNGDVC